MQIMRDESPKSSYQPRPAAPPSAGRALSVLVAVCAVLWVWLMLPRWWQIVDASQQEKMRNLVFNELVVWSLAIGLNIILLLYATRPMWQGTRPNPIEEAKRGFVLLLCLMFHLFTPPAAFLSVLAIKMD